LDEEAPLRKTRDPYGDTKIDAERILAATRPAGASRASRATPCA
jgi:hypothetical protein